MDIKDGMKVAVVGGAGNIGSHLVDLLVERGCDVTVIDDLSVGSRDKIAHHGDKVKLIVADIRKKEDMLKHLKGYENGVIFNLACQVLRKSIKDSYIVNDVNTIGTINVLEACRQNGVGKFVYCSSSEAYGTAKSLEGPMDENHPLIPRTPYGASKAAGELYTWTYRNTFDINTQIVRPFNTYGPRCDVAGVYGTVIPKHIIRVLNGVEPLIFGDGEQTRDYTYIKDTARGILAAAECDALKGEPVNISRGKEITVNRIAEVVLEACKEQNVVPVPKDLKPKYIDARPGDVRRHLGCTKKAKAVLGYEAKIDVEQGIRLYRDWLLEQEKKSPGYLKKLLESEQPINW